MNTDGIERLQRFAPPPDPTAARKLDALLHLLANLPRPIMLLGPHGAGKTSLLRQLQARAPEAWTVCYIAADANLSLSRILEELSRLLRIPLQSYDEAEMESLLEERIAALAQRGDHLVLLLDEAHILMPGLLAALCQFARLHPAVKLIFSLRPEEIQGKTLTDGLALSDAHPMRLSLGAQEKTGGRPAAAAASVARPATPKPPANDIDPMPKRSFALLSAALLLVFLAALGLLYFLWPTSAPTAAPGISAPARPEPARTERVPPDEPAKPAERPQTAQTPAPPAVLPESAAQPAEPKIAPAPSRSEDSSQAVATQTLPSTRQPPLESAPATPSSAPPAPPERTEAPVPAAMPEPSRAAPIPAIPANAQAEIRSPPNAAPFADAPETTPKEPVAPPKPPAEPKPIPTPVQPVPTAKETKPPPRPAETSPKPAPQRSALPLGNDIETLKDAGWLMSQDPSAYSLQLIAVSRLSSLAEYVKRVPSSDRLATFRSIKGFNDLYPLFYGIYPDLAAAKAAAADLPASLGKPVPRQLKSIQQEIQRTAPAHLDTQPPTP